MSVYSGAGFLQGSSLSSSLGSSGQVVGDVLANYNNYLDEMIDQTAIYIGIELDRIYQLINQGSQQFDAGSMQQSDLY